MYILTNRKKFEGTENILYIFSAGTELFIFLKNKSYIERKFTLIMDIPHKLAQLNILMSIILGFELTI